jgi:mRNA interferase MazF
VISPVEMNLVLQTIIVAPITSQPKKYPTRVKINQKGVAGMIALDQIRTIDRRRIVKEHGTGTIRLGEEIKSVIKEMLVD